MANEDLKKGLLRRDLARDLTVFLDLTKTDRPTLLDLGERAARPRAGHAQ
jgi:hypothetical protein